MFQTSRVLLALLGITALSAIWSPQAALVASPNKPFKIALLTSTPANLYDLATLEGSLDAVADKGSQRHPKYEIVPFYSQFNLDIQLQQCEDVIASGEYAAMVIGPVSATGLNPCVADAGAAGLPVIAAGLHLGDDPNTSEIQVDGQVGAVVVPPAAVGPAFAALAINAVSASTPARSSTSAACSPS